MQFYLLDQDDSEVIREVTNNFNFRTRVNRTGAYKMCFVGLSMLSDPGAIVMDVDVGVEEEEPSLDDDKKKFLDNILKENSEETSGMPANQKEQFLAILVKQQHQKRLSDKENSTDVSIKVGQ